MAAFSYLFGVLNEEKLVSWEKTSLTLQKVNVTLQKGKKKSLINA